MTIAKTVVDKAIVGFVAAAMIFGMFAPAAQAQTTEELQKMINDLMAQVTALQGQGGTSGSVASGICPFSWTRDLKSGLTGADVMKLQQFLNSNVDTRVSASGAGSVGMETQYFGPATAAAVSKFQVMHRADILTPAGLVNPTGFFGPSTRAKANSLCTAAPAPTPMPGDEDEDEDEDEDNENMELSGEGTLDKFEMDNASDSDVQEGAEDAEIAEIKVEAADGDIEVDRMTFQLNDGSVANTEQDPWEVFETISLWVDGDMVAEFTADDEDMYLDEDDGEFRFSGLDLVLREDEEVEIIVGATVMNSVDGAGSATLADWELEVTEVRYFDADGVSEDDSTTGDIDNNVTANFKIVEEGDGEELKFSLASSNPDSTDIVVDLDNSTDGVTILEFNIEAEEADIELNDLFIDVTTLVNSNLVIEDASIDIEGEMFDAENSASTTGTVTKFQFDVDGDVVVEEGEKVLVKLMVDLRSQESSSNVARYSNGTTIRATVDVDDTKAEGADNIATGDLKGSAVGKTHTLVAEGITLEVNSTDAKNTINNTTAADSFGEFKINFDVTAVEETAFVALTAARSTGTAAAIYEIEDANGNSVATGTVTESLTRKSGGTVSGGYVEISEGDSATFELVVTYNPTAAGQFRVQLKNVGFAATAVVASVSDRSLAIPAEDFETSNVLITN